MDIIIIIIILIIICCSCIILCGCGFLYYNSLSMPLSTTLQQSTTLQPSNNTIDINKIIVNNTDKRYEILLTFFNTLMKEYCICKIIIKKNKIFNYDKMISYNYNNLFFRHHFDCYILSVKNFLCYKCCC